MYGSGLHPTPPSIRVTHLKCLQRRGDGLWCVEVPTKACTATRRRTGAVVNCRPHSANGFPRKQRTQPSAFAWLVTRLKVRHVKKNSTVGQQSSHELARQFEIQCRLLPNDGYAKLRPH